MANLLQLLGIQSPGIGVVQPDDQGGGSPPGIVPGNIAPAPMTAQGVDPNQIANALQGLNGGTAYADPAQTPQGQAPVAPKQGERRSVLDTVGRLADVFARVGGSEALYQPTLDQRQDRSMAIADRSRSIDLDALRKTLLQQQTQSGATELTGQQNTLAGQAIRGLQAFQKANPGADVTAVWPMLAKQAGIPDDRAQQIGQALAANPGNLDALASEFNGSTDKLGMQPFYAADSQGNTKAYQLNGQGEPVEIKLPTGFSPVNPLKIVDTGGAQYGIDARTGKVVTTLGKTEAPGKAEDRAQRGQIADARNATQITIAGMPARAKAGDVKGASPEASNVLTLLDNIEGGFNDLHGMGALPGDKGNNPLTAFGRTSVGQAIGEQAGIPSAQKRLEIMKNVSALQQAMLKSLPASATRTKFEQEMLARGLPDPSKMSMGTANTVIGQLRASYLKALQDAQATTTTTPSAPRKLPPRLTTPGYRPAPASKPAVKNAGKPTVSNW